MISIIQKNRSPTFGIYDLPPTIANITQNKLNPIEFGYIIDENLLITKSITVLLPSSLYPIAMAMHALELLNALSQR